jgi:hypothetical protein
MAPVVTGRGRGQPRPSRAEGWGDGTRGRPHALGMTGGCAPVQATRALTRRAMGGRPPGVASAARALGHAGEHRARGGTGAVALRRAADAGPRPPAREPRAAARRRGRGVAPAWPQARAAVVVRIPRPPPGMTRAVAGPPPRRQRPRVAGPRPSAPAPRGRGRPERQPPGAAGRSGDVAAACAQARWPVAGAPVPARGAPAPGAEQGAGNAGMVAARGVGGRAQAWLPRWAGGVLPHGGQPAGDEGMGSGGRSTS